MESTLPIYIIPVLKTPEYTYVKPKAFGVFFHILDHFIPHARNNYHPHIFSHRMLSLLSGLLISVKIFTIALLSFGPIIPAFSSAINSSNIISLTNQSRAEYQLMPLVENAALSRAAASKARDMLAKGYFAHSSPDGKTPWDFIVSTGYNYITAGENLAVNFNEAENVESAWMNSPGHKANIVNKNFEEIGIGISQGEYQGHDAIFVVQMFGTPSEQKVTLSETPTQVQTLEVPEPVVQKAPVLAQSAVVSETKAPSKPKHKETLLLSAVKIENKPELKTEPAKASENLLLIPPSVIQSEISIDNSITKLEDGQIKISSQVSENAVRVIAQFGTQTVWLSPKQNNVWEAQVPLSDLLQNNAQVVIKASDIFGKSKTVQLASFASSTADNFKNSVGSVKGAQVSFIGRTFNPNIFQHQFYLLFITLMLVSMVLAIGIHRHIQHVSVVANGAFVVVLAVLLWVS